MGKDKFHPNEAYLFHKKVSAQKKAESLRKDGFRAEVREASKTTQKRSPQLRWAVFRGQRRR